MHVKSRPKAKLGKVEVGSNIAMFSIACLGDTKSYVVIICANSCEKSTKSENVST